MVTIGVDCTFSAGGSVQVSRVKIDEEWQMVGQGRQWLDQHGRHVLIIVSGNKVREIILRPDTLAWEMSRDRGDVRVV